MALIFCLAPRPGNCEAWDFAAGGGAYYGSTFRQDHKDGLGVSVYADLGLTETLSLTFGGAYAKHFIGSGQAYSLAGAGVGIGYKIDTLVVVPFAALRLGWLLTSFEDESASSGLGVCVTVGFDYLVTESFSVGFAAEYRGMLSDFVSFPAYAAFTTRVGYRLPF
jgi:outer membrane protein W